MRKNKIAILGIILSMLLLSACQNNVEKPITITVEYPSPNEFYKRYGHAFEQKSPLISIQVIPEADQSSPADLRYMDNLSTYKKLIDSGELLNLESYIKEEPGAWKNITPIMFDTLKIKFGDQLYGLAPTFSSYAIYYNKDLFAKYKIPFPKNQSTWKDIFDLATRFPLQTDDGEPLYGFKPNYYENVGISLIMRWGQTEGLRFIDPETLKIQMNTPAWKEIWRRTIDALRSGRIYKQTQQTEGAMSLDPIYTGNAAMALQSHVAAYNFDINQLYGAGQPINWDMVTVPVDPRKPEYCDYYLIKEIYGISTASERQEAAWELLKWMVQGGAMTSTEINHGLPARTELIASVKGHDLSPLTMLKASPSNHNPYESIHYDIINAFKSIGNQIVEDVIANKLTIDEALILIDEKGQQAVDAAAIEVSKSEKNNDSE
ncbi:extracellular solute-binding protein [Paenibacillus alvei]|uniref:Extracellular solute-binding protein n=1 Tax=Paenibacillus alvei TaxID=44250 RepID=A0ABT4GTJ0_PAEAL|nr:extracellular solute-binding protein [Paenibacillus alvei]MCY9760012.1 extracellular solute-binding protein [Paenibacillus alvei]MCY9770063.1 extracellular solute-binding protein [Paenibacillus alvei]